GAEDLHSVDDLVDAIATMLAKKPSIAQVVVKLNEGVSGKGNAMVDLAGVPAGAGARAAIAGRVTAMAFESADVTRDQYLEKFTAHGGIVEERIMGREFRSPSAQMRVTPLGKVELLSTHDQMLGGPSGQTYLGCRFPASLEYGPTI